MIDKEIDALFIGKGNVLTSESIDLGKYNKVVDNKKHKCYN